MWYSQATGFYLQHIVLCSPFSQIELVLLLSSTVKEHRTHFSHNCFNVVFELEIIDNFQFNNLQIKWKQFFLKIYNACQRWYTGDKTPCLMWYNSGGGGLTVSTWHQFGIWYNFGIYLPVWCKTLGHTLLFDVHLGNNPSHTSPIWWTNLAIFNWFELRTTSTPSTGSNPSTLDLSYWPKFLYF